MKNKNEENIFKGFITVNKASTLFNVCKSTIRRWADRGKIKSIRHPVNKFRLFSKSEIKKVVNSFRKKT
ncbi:MAG: helix-turn-helix domain-containing protein [Oligoflexia bacterium]|nr:helix-turn-helix domain-containing protein [Oligoflexia bacterium]